jgi:hypothetical protein
MRFARAHGKQPRVRSFGEIAGQLVRRKRSAEGVSNERLQRAWEHVVGEEIAGQTKLRSFAGGRLTVDVATPALLHELSGFMMTDLVRALQQESGGRDVAAVRFRLQQAGPGKVI